MEKNFDLERERLVSDNQPPQPVASDDAGGPGMVGSSSGNE